MTLTTVLLNQIDIILNKILSTLNKLKNKTKYKRYLCLFYVLAFTINAALGEGSKEMAANGGHRAYFLSSNTVSVYNPFPTWGTVKVYVQTGETLYLGSSAVGIAAGRINVRAAGGATYTTNTQGLIPDRAREIAGPSTNGGVDGGYNPYTITVGAGQTGVWEIDFLAPVTNNANVNPPSVLASDNWVQDNNVHFISAFDVSVRNNANTAFIPGRAYLNVFGGNLGSFSSLFNARFKVLTKDGYIYDVNNNGQAGFQFVFFVNNKGFRDIAGNAIYRSVNTTNINPTTDPSVHDPRVNDTPTDITHKIFFNQPNTDLPSVANTPGGSTWLLNAPVSPTVSDFLFRGREGTINAAGTYPLGGTVSFNTNQPGSYVLKIDVNKNGSFDDPIDVRLTGSALNGTNEVYWNGLNGLGAPVGGSFSFNPANMNISLVGGEVHFPFLDVENNVNGIIITRTNGVNYQPDVVYWDDTDITATVNPSNPRKTDVNGISSSINGHKWGSTAYSDVAFGNLVGLDTWTYVISSPVLPYQNVVLRQADLEIQNITVNKPIASYCVGEDIVYTVRVRNNGPDAVTNAKFAFNFPNDFVVSTVSNVMTNGTGSVSNGAQSATSYTADLDMSNQAIITFQITGKVTAYNPAGVAVNASIMRPADVTDPDATNPDALPPTDPLIECNSGTVGCNNILTHTSVTLSRVNISIAGSGGVEGTGGTSNIVFPVTLSATSNCPISVDYAIEHVTTNNADFAGALTGTITIPAGQMTGNITIPIATDNIIEANETFNVRISNATGGNQIIGALAVGTILNDDHAEIRVAVVDGYEENEVSAKYIFSFPNGITSDRDVEIDYVLAGTANEGADYTRTNTGTLIIPAGSSSAEILLNIIDDAIVEGTEDILLNSVSLRSPYSQPYGNDITLNSSNNRILIYDNDKATVRIVPTVTEYEGDTGFTNFIFNVTLDAVTSAGFTLNFKTSDGTALAGEDYVAEDRVVTFNGPAQTIPVTVRVRGDRVIESDEYFHVTIGDLSNTYSGNLTISNASALGNIRNDDYGTIDITSADGTEDGAAAQFIFTLRDGRTADTDISINYTLTGKANGNGVDYDKPQTGTIVILKGQNAATLYLNAHNDNLVEGTENVIITVNSVAHPSITLGNNTQTLNILDINTAGISVADAQVIEGNAGYSNLVFRLILNGRTDRDFTVPFTIEDINTTAGTDYVVPATSFVSFSPNLATQERTVTIQVIGDYQIEANETFRLRLGTPSQTFSGQLLLQNTTAIGTIINDDEGKISVSAISGKEENEEPVQFVFSFPANVTSDTDTPVDFTLAGSTATAGQDYVDPAIHRAIIPAGSNSVTLMIAVHDDDIVEGTEKIVLTPQPIIGIPNVSVNTFPVSADIEDNDYGTITIAGPENITEGNMGETPVATYTITLNKAIQRPVQITYRTEDGTAKAGEDYIGVLNTYTFVAGPDEQEIQVNVTINGDNKIEENETFHFLLNALTETFENRLSIVNSPVTTTIINDDDANITISKIDGIEGSQNARFIIGFENGYSADQPISIPYKLTGTAIGNGIDYTGATTGTITIPAGQSNVFLDLPVIADNLVEDTETVTLTFNEVTLPYHINYERERTLNIFDNNAAGINISNASVTEGDDNDVYLSFNVTLVGDQVQDAFNLPFTVQGITATVVEDFEIPALTSLSFNGPADRSKEIRVVVKGDRKIEKDETLQVILGTLSNALGGHLTINQTTATGTILDNDKGVIRIVPVEGNEENTVAAGFRFEFLNGITSDEATIINYNLSGEAIAGTDYNFQNAAQANSFTIPAGAGSATMQLPVVDDEIIEGREDILLSINTNTPVTSVYANNISVQTASAQAYIEDNDTGELILTAGPNTTEGDEGSVKTVTFRLRLNKETSRPFTINYQFSDVTAINGEDYNAGSGSWSFTGAKDETHEITATIIGDNKIEANETFRFTVSPASLYSGLLTVPTTTHDFTIIDDDNANIILTKKDGIEGSESVDFIFSLEDGKTADKDIQILYELSGTADSGSDYVGAVSGSVTLGANTNSVKLQLAASLDGIIEGDETVILTVPATGVSSTYGIQMVNSTITALIKDIDTGTVTIGDITKTEGNNNTSYFEFPVTLDKKTKYPLDITYSTQDITALAGEDYIAQLNQVLTFTDAGIRLIRVEVKGDMKIELDETFRVILQQLSHTYGGQLTFTKTEGLGTITNDDFGNISITSVNGNEEGEVPVQFIFKFPQDITAGEDITLNYSFSGSADRDIDYTVPNYGTFIFPKGQNSATLSLNVINDELIEGTESVVLNIAGNPQSIFNHISITNPTISANILDNDFGILRVIPPANTAEGNEGETHDYVYTLVLDKAAKSAFDVRYHTADLTATAGLDYIDQAGQVHFDAGVANQTKTISVRILGDNIIEADEQFQLILDEIIGDLSARITIDPATKTTSSTIIDDDFGNVSISATNGTEGGQNASFIFSLPSGIKADRDIVINYNLDGTAMGGGVDYQAPMNGQVTIKAGDTQAILDITIVDDVIVEGTETVTLTAAIHSGPHQVSLVNATAGLTIADNDYGTITIAAVSKEEGNTGTTSFVFSVNLNAQVKESFNLTYRTEDITAQAPKDYTAITNGSLSFDGQPATKSITVLVNGDKEVELDEQFAIQLLGLDKTFDNHLSISVNRATGTILNDDKPKITITPANGNEAGLVAGNFRFKFEEDYTSTVPTLITYVLGGSATTGADYQDTHSGSITIPAGENFVDLVLPVLQDEIVEGTEDVTITATLNSALAGITLPITTSQLDILDDDEAELTLTVDHESIVEGNTGTKEVIFSVRLSKATKSGFALNYRTEDITATAGEDYASQTGQLVFDGSAGQVVQVRVNINGDLKIEQDEQFKLVLSGLNRTFENRLKIANTEQIVTIVNDDFAVLTVTPQNGTEGSVDGAFVFSLPNGITSDKPITIQYQLTGTASSTTDYSTTATGTVTLAAGQNEVTLPIILINDNVLELDETVLLNITSVASAYPVQYPVVPTTLIIHDDDTGTLILTAPVAQTEKDSGEETVYFTVQIDKPISQPVSVSYQTQDVSALSGEDYTAVNGVLNFPANVNAGQNLLIGVKIKGDKKVEDDEVFNLVLGALSENYGGRLTISNTFAAYTILNDDEAKINITARNGGEGNPDRPYFRFGFENGYTSDRPVTISYTLGGTATINTDYTLAQGTPVSVTIPAGAGYVDLAFDVIDDELVEHTETIVLNAVSITSGSHGNKVSLGTNQTLTLNIADNDNAELIVRGIEEIEEGNTGEKIIEYTVELTRSTQYPFIIRLGTQDGTAKVSDQDYIAYNDQQSHSGDKSQILTIPVRIVGDYKIEEDETFYFSVVGIDDNYEGRLSYSSVPFKTTIKNDDHGEITVTNADGLEGTNNGSFTFSLPANISVDKPTVIHYRLDGTASSTTDYTTPRVGTITIPAGANSVTLPIVLINDNVLERDETVVLTVTDIDSDYGLISQVTTSTITIRDDDTGTITLTAPAAQTEKDSGEEPVYFTVSISSPIEENIAVNYQTQDMTALAAEDYTAVSGVLNFPANVSSGQQRTIEVRIRGDKKIEADEVLRLLLNGLSENFGGRLTFVNTQADYTILNDDEARINITARHGGEGMPQQPYYRFEIENDYTSDKPVTINFNLGGTATPNTDYTISQGTATSVTIPAGEKFVDLIFNVIDDEIVEPTENISINSVTLISAYPSEITLGTARPSIQITDNDSAELLLTGVEKVIEGNAGVTQVTYTLTLTKSTQEAFTIKLATEDGLAKQSDNDYFFSAKDVIHDGDKNTVLSVTVDINGDRKVERDEDFLFKILSISNTYEGRLNVANSSVKTTIENDDFAEITITGRDGEETPANNKSGVFTFSLPNGIVVDEDVFITYTLSGTATSADYHPVSGTATIAAGRNSVDVIIDVIDDNIVEGDETVVITATILPSSYGIRFKDNVNTNTIRIVDNDYGLVSINNVSVQEQHTGNHTLSFDVKIDKEVSQSFKVYYRTEDVTATSGEDYIAIPSGELSIGRLPSDVNKINVTYKGDRTVEADEIFRLVLTGIEDLFGGHLQLQTGQHIGEATLLNDDEATVRITATHGREDGNTGKAIYTFTLVDRLGNEVDADKPVTLRYTLGGTATTADYTLANSGLLTEITIPTGSKSTQLVFNIVDDEIVEGTENIILQNLQLITAYPQIVLGSQVPVLEIEDNDTATLTVSGAPRIVEGDSNEKDYVFNVKLDKATARNFTLAYRTEDITAAAGEDYIAVSGILNFRGEKDENYQIIVKVKGDHVVEPDETFRLLFENLSNNFANRLTLSQNSITGEIENDDFTAIVITTQNGKEGGDNAVFTFSLSNGKTVDEDLLIYYNLDNISARLGDDYSIDPQFASPLRIPKGSTGVALVLNVTDDLLVEGTEQVTLSATTGNNPRNNIQISNPQATLDIEDNDHAVLSVTSPSITEGHTGTQDLVFTVSLSQPTQDPFTVKYHTTDGSAVAGEDYLAVAEGVLSFDRNNTSRTFTVKIIGDRKVEANEDFLVTLSDLSQTFGGHLSLPAAPAKGTINDDDDARISISGTNGKEQGPVDGKFIFRIADGVSVDKPLTIRYTLSGDATAGEDYNNAASGTITFAAGETEKVLDIQVIDDDKVENEESVILNAEIITNPYPQHVSLINNSHTIWIEDNDAATLTLTGTAEVVEGNSGYKELLYTVTLNHATATGFSIESFTQDGTAKVADEDYNQANETIFFTGAAGEQKTFKVIVKGDEKVEDDETFRVGIRALNIPGNLTGRLQILGSPLTVTIKNDDAGIVSISKIDGEETTDNSKPAQFIFALNGNITADKDIVIPYNLSTNSAQGNGIDYNGSLNGTITIPAGQQRAALSLSVIDDDIVEGTETLTLTTVNPALPRDITLSNTSQTLSVIDNDEAYIQVDNVRVLEGDNGTSNMVFTVSLDKVTQQGFWINYHTEDGTAKAGEDYVGVTNGTINFNALSKNPATFHIIINGDKKVEADETLRIILQSLSADYEGRLHLPALPAIGTIENDDILKIALTGTDGKEEGPVNGTFTFSLLDQVTVDQPVTISYRLSGTATGNGVDYQNSSVGTLVIPANANKGVMDITVIDDLIIEEIETVIIDARIEGNPYPNAVALQNDTHTISIEDNDSGTIHINGPLSIQEGDSGSQILRFEVKLSNPVSKSFTLAYRTQDGTATLADNDYQEASGVLSFSGETAGETQWIPVAINGDTKVEGNEYFSVLLDALSETFGGRLRITGSPAIANIIDDDNLAINKTISIKKQDGEEGLSDASFTFSFPAGITLDTDTRIAFDLGGTATINEDYTVLNPSFIVIEAGKNSATLRLRVNDDDIIEDTEQVDLVVSRVENQKYPDVKMESTQSSLSIFDNDKGKILIQPRSITEGDTNVKEMVFLLTLEKETAQPFKIKYHTEDGTAKTSDNDYFEVAAEVAFLGKAGETQEIRVRIIGDKKIEQDEYFNLILSQLSNSFNNRLSLFNTTIRGTIENDDSSQLTVTKTDGEEGGNPVTFTFSLDQDVSADEPIVIDYFMTSESTAIGNGVDYIGATSGSVIIAPGQHAVTLILPVVDDELIEDDETIVLKVSAAKGTYGSLITIPTGTTTAKIIDNDIARLRILGPVSVVEGDVGVAEARFTVLLDNDTGNPFTVNYHTLDGTATVADNDYIPKSETLSFAGQKGERKEIIILINGDKKIEGDENFFVELSSLSNNFNNRLVIDVARAEGIIIDDDNIEANKIIRITKTDGAEGGNDVVFTFSYPQNVTSDYPTNIPYALSGTAKGGGIDYAGNISGVMTIPAGANSVTLRLPVVDDEIVEGTEIVALKTGNAASESYGAVMISNPSIEAQILDNDFGTIRIEDTQITEGNLGTKEVEVSVLLDKATGTPFTINYQTEDVTAKVSDNDYIEVKQATVSFNGQQGERQLIKVVVRGDRKIEADEIFDVVLKNLSQTFEGGLSIQKSVAHVTILNDDVAEIVVTGMDGAEAGTIPARFKFSFPLGYTADIPTVVNYTLGGTATAGGVDYKGAAAGVFAIPANAESAILELPVIDDEIIEDDETITISINALNTNYPSSITINPNLPTVKIIDNDFTVLRLSEPVVLKEGNNGTTAYNFNLTLEKETGQSFTVKYATQDGTATVADRDFNQAEGSLPFAGHAGETQNVTVWVNGDLKIEADEIFKFKVFDLSNDFNKRLTIPVTEVNNTILNDDNSQITVSVIDGIEGMQDGKFVFSLNPGVTSDKDIIVHFRLSGTATTSDYTALPSATSVTIPAGQTSAAIDIKVIDDDYLEETETVIMTVTGINNPYNNVTMTLPIPVLKIYDNDTGNLSISSPSPITEGHIGTKKVTFTITLDRTTDKPFTVNYTTVDGTATLADKDYVKASGYLSFAGFKGETKKIEVTINGDTKYESDETFGFKLMALSPTFDGKLIIGADGLATILNDDYAPVAMDDMVTTDEDVPVTFSVTDNDRHDEGIDTATVQVVINPKIGKIEVHKNGTVTYTPDQDVNGYDFFTYTVKDIFGRISNEAKVNINIIPVNDAPVAVDDIYYVQRDSSIRENVSLNDYDVDGDVLTFRILELPKHGKIEFFDGSDGSFIYVPEVGYKGIDHFTYEVKDPEGLRDTALVTLYVQPKVRVDLTPVLSTVVEGDMVKITARLDESIFQDVNVTLDFAGTAEQGKDYTLEGNYDVITIPAGETVTAQYFMVKTIRDLIQEDDETIEANIVAVDPSNFVTIGDSALVVVQDFYPGKKPEGPNENGQIQPDPYMSPNGDGQGNEVFTIYNIEQFPDNEVVIYNRWGNEVFRIKGYNNKDVSFAGKGNTGSFVKKGEDLVDGVYYFIIHTKDTSGKPLLNKGYVIIRR